MTKIFIAFVTLLVFSPVLVQELKASGPVEEWIKKYNGPSDSSDIATSIALDNNGNIYVWGGSCDDLLYPTCGYALVKYDTNGNEVWERRHYSYRYWWEIDIYSVGEIDKRKTLAVDKDGNVYVTGVTSGMWTNSDYVVIKYDTNGNKLWERSYNGSQNSTDISYGIAIDMLGNVYVAGLSYNTGTYWDYTTIKYNSNGDELWVRRYNGIANWVDFATAIAVDGAGNVYVTGQSYIEGQGTGVTTIKYDTNGNELWIRDYKEPASEYDIGRAITFDNDGNVYVGGRGHSYEGIHYLVIKYDTNGNELWVKTYKTPTSDYAIFRGLSIDQNGNVYVTGGESGWDYLTVKYDKNGNELWVKKYAQSFARDLVIDMKGNIYVTGISGTGTYTTVKYDSNGNDLWVKRYDNCIGGTATAIAVDEAGNVYVTGGGMWYGSSSSTDYLTVKYTEAVLDAPNAPTNLTAIAVSSSQINLSWVDNSNNEDGFKVMRATTSGGPYSLIAVIPANAITYEDTGLSPETIYYYKVRAFNVNGDSGYATVIGAGGCSALFYEVSVTSLPENSPPNCIGASPSFFQLWPPEHKMKAVNILNVIDSDGDPISYIITGITQDEPVKESGSGYTSPDGTGIGTDTALIRAEREGEGNGRVYHVSFAANDGKGGECSGAVTICVPHDQDDVGCVDDDQIYDSTLQ